MNKVNKGSILAETVPSIFIKSKIINNVEYMKVTASSLKTEKIAKKFY